MVGAISCLYEHRYSVGSGEDPHHAPLHRQRLGRRSARHRTVIARDGADDTNKWGWGENIGWTNWADAGDGMEAACLDTDHLEGFVWGENIGFINLGNGDGPYTNTDGIDFGVNIDPVTGEASGFAWGENVGWINFGTTPRSSARTAPGTTSPRTASAASRGARTSAGSTSTTTPTSSPSTRRLRLPGRLQR